MLSVPDASPLAYGLFCLEGSLERPGNACYSALVNYFGADRSTSATQSLSVLCQG